MVKPDGSKVLPDGTQVSADAEDLKAAEARDSNFLGLGLVSHVFTRGNDSNTRHFGSPKNPLSQVHTSPTSLAMPVKECTFGSCRVFEVVRKFSANSYPSEFLPVLF